MPVETIKLNDDQLTIVGKLALPGVLSSRGNSHVVLSTGGFIDIPDSEYRINLIVIKPNKIRLGHAGAV